jgi:hypothetical protein
MEFKKGSCRYSEEVTLPAAHYLDKSVKIHCMKSSSSTGASSQDEQRSLTDDDKRQLRELLADVSKPVYILYQSTDGEALKYANDIYQYIKSLGFRTSRKPSNALGRDFSLKKLRMQAIPATS